MRCCICGADIKQENISKEHIIHNAIGGILKSEMIYCKKCNGEYGSDNDKAFVQIFAPIVDSLDMNFERKTEKTSYTGRMCDRKGNLYKTRFKNKKVVEIFDEDGKYRKWESEKYQKLSFDFNLDNEAYKMGIAKIAFNFAVYSGIEVNKLNNLFDIENNEIVKKPFIIPFVPMTLFDTLMEEQDTCNLFHVLRLFTYKNFLYAYIELFSTFQQYVLLSDNYSGEIYNEYCQVINKNCSEKQKVELMESLKILDYKDAIIMAEQYQIDIKKVIEDLEQYHSYDGENINVVFEQIQKMAYEKIRKRSYERDYLEMIGEKYSKIDWLRLLNEEMDSEEKIRAYSEFQYYTCYKEDNVNMERYKLLLELEGEEYSYPERLINVMHVDTSVFKEYGHLKFGMLMQHLQK